MEFDGTPEDEIGKVALFAPPAIVTDMGGETAGFEDCSETESPPAGAAPDTLTVPVALCPPTIEVGVIFRLDRVGAFTIRTAAAEVEFRLAVIVADESAPVASVVIAKVEDFEPFGTVTVEGRCTDMEVDDNVTVAPPVPATAVSVTVPEALAPPKTEVGVTETLEMSCP